MRDTVISFKASPGKVDVENRILHNVIMAQVGEAKGHGFSVELSFIEEVVKQSSGENGLISNFGHNYDNLGLQFGRVKNVHLDGEKAVGDLHIYSNADNSPRFPKMGTWLINQASEDPESVMLSIKFRPSHYYQYDDNGKQIKLKYTWWDGLQIKFEDKPVFIALKKLHSVDIVDSGALTDKMFSNPQDDNSFIQFLKEVFSNQKNIEMSDNVKDPDGITDGAVDKTESFVEIGEEKISLSDAATTITALRDAALQSKSEIEAFNAKIAEFEKQLSEKDAEITELKKQPAATHTDGAEPTGNASAKVSEDKELAELGRILRGEMVNHMQ